jgi:hypothetical protein
MFITLVNVNTFTFVKELLFVHHVDFKQTGNYYANSLVHDRSDTVKTLEWKDTHIMGIYTRECCCDSDDMRYANG